MTDNIQAKSFRNMNELTAYLTTFENRIAKIESENQLIRSVLNQVKQQSMVSSFKTESGLPKTGLVSDSFLLCAFTVWGHYLVAQLIIGIPIFICYLIFFFFMMANMGY